MSSRFHEGPVYSVTFNQNGTRLVSSGGILASVWDPMTGRQIANMIHDGVVNPSAFSPDGKFVVSGDDKTARVWNAETGVEMARITHENLVNFASFSPDGEFILSGGYDKTARIWHWQTADLIADACKLLPRNLTIEEWEQYIESETFQPICPGLPTDTRPTPETAP